MIQADIQAQRPGITEASRRSPAWLGAIAVLTALASALATFLVLGGMTPILPTHEVVVWVFSINAALVLLLVGIVTWQTRRLMRERRAGAAGAGLHIRVVSLFSLVAVLPAILVAIVASAILERGLDPWFTGSIKSLMTNTVEIAQAYRADQCRTLARETQLVAADLNRAKVLFDADRRVFRDFMTSRATFLGLPVAMIVKPDGTIVERVDIRALPGVVGPSSTTGVVPASTERTSTCSPPTCVGGTASSHCPSPRRAAVAVADAVTHARGSSTPLGAPVEPEE